MRTIICNSNWKKLLGFRNLQEKLENQLTVKSVEVSLLDSNTKNSSTDTHEKNRQSDQGMSRANPILGHKVQWSLSKY